MIAFAPMRVDSQVDFVFYNKDKLVVTTYDEPVIIADPGTGECIRPSGDAWPLELLAGPEGTPVADFHPLVPLLNFESVFGPGYVPAQLFDVPGGVPGQREKVVVRVFLGPDFESSAVRGVAGPFTVTLDGPPGPPNLLFLPPRSLDFCVPEPSTLRLLGFGAAVAAVAAYPKRIRATAKIFSPSVKSRAGPAFQRRGSTEANESNEE
jgi:hypothetical protein